eukprot:CAMPEP_0206294434 /NCGR_PEP_ID=MMETSP0106_2-20121207/4656_1 /ASSEMBLY_ACC=CAM_ASM_000206 /TAXON_ID=81532 /ORGANISM="Acanthoeca-like sp., Strain 10tr" /LENGTH=1041 /DNA_ID=CAMNT_0053725071 /DNA_START=27 /DNA_END=3150 /DNA_ORIENTATION=+
MEPEQRGESEAGQQYGRQGGTASTATSRSAPHSPSRSTRPEPQVLDHPGPGTSAVCEPEHALPLEGPPSLGHNTSAAAAAVDHVSTDQVSPVGGAPKSSLSGPDKNLRHSDKGCGGSHSPGGRPKPSDPGRRPGSPAAESGTGCRRESDEPSHPRADHDAMHSPGPGGRGGGGHNTSAAAAAAAVVAGGGGGTPPSGFQWHHNPDAEGGSAGVIGSINTDPTALAQLGVPNTRVAFFGKQVDVPIAVQSIAPETLYILWVTRRVNTAGMHPTLSRSWLDLTNSEKRPFVEEGVRRHRDFIDWHNAQMVGMADAARSESGHSEKFNQAAISGHAEASGGERSIATRTHPHRHAMGEGPSSFRRPLSPHANDDSTQHYEHPSSGATRAATAATCTPSGTVQTSEPGTTMTESSRASDGALLPYRAAHSGQSPALVTSSDGTPSSSGDAEPAVQPKRKPVLVPRWERPRGLGVKTARTFCLWANCACCDREFTLNVDAAAFDGSPATLYCRVACRERAEASGTGIAAAPTEAWVASTAIEHDKLPHAAARAGPLGPVDELYPSELVEVQPPQYPVGTVVVVGLPRLPIGDSPETTQRLAVVVAPSYFSKRGKLLMRVRWLHLVEEASIGGDASWGWTAVTAAVRECCLRRDGTACGKKHSCRLGASNFVTANTFVSTVPEGHTTARLCFSGLSLLQPSDQEHHRGATAAASAADRTSEDEAGNAFRRHLQPVECLGPGTRATKLRGPFLGVFPGTLPVQKTKQKMFSTIAKRAEAEVTRLEKGWLSGQAPPPLLSIDNGQSTNMNSADLPFEVFTRLHGSSVSRQYHHFQSPPTEAARRIQGAHKVVWNLMPPIIRHQMGCMVAAIRDNGAVAPVASSPFAPVSAPTPVRGSTAAVAATPRPGLAAPHTGAADRATHTVVGTPTESNHVVASHHGKPVLTADQSQPATAEEVVETQPPIGSLPSADVPVVRHTAEISVSRGQKRQASNSAADPRAAKLPRQVGTSTVAASGNQSNLQLPVRQVSDKVPHSSSPRQQLLDALDVG